MVKTLAEVMAKFSPEEQAEIRAEAEKLIAEEKIWKMQNIFTQEIITEANRLCPNLDWLELIDKGQEIIQKTDKITRQAVSEFYEQLGYFAGLSLTPNLAMEERFRNEQKKGDLEDELYDLASEMLEKIAEFENNNIN